MAEFGAWLAGLPFITDPLFYAAAVPAVLMMGLSKSGFLIGFARSRCR